MKLMIEIEDAFWIRSRGLFVTGDSSKSETRFKVGDRAILIKPSGSKRDVRLLGIDMSHGSTNVGIHLNLEIGDVGRGDKLYKEEDVDVR